MNDLHRWTQTAITELGIPPEVLAEATTPVLDLVRDIAHGVNRPSAPLTAFLVGLSAGAATPGATPEQTVAEVRARIERVQALIAQWEPTAD